MYCNNNEERVLRNTLSYLSSTKYDLRQIGRQDIIEKIEKLQKEIEQLVKSSQ